MSATTAELTQTLPIFLRELRRYSVPMALTFAAIALLSLVAGLLWPRTYVASTTILAQGSDIIQPLLEGRAVATDVSDRAGMARQMIFSRKVMADVLGVGGWLDQPISAAEQDKLMEQVRDRTTVSSARPELIQITYRDSDPHRTLAVTQRFAEKFIEENRAAKERESREAFEFIDKQVRDYHAKLTGAEDDLLKYRSGNADAQPGSAADSTARISALRAQLEQARLSYMELQSREGALVAQMSGESEVTAVQTRATLYRTQLIELQNQLDQLLLNYTDRHPDVVRVRLQIQDIQQQLARDAARPQGAASNSLSENAQFNPLYQQLRTQLSELRREIAATRSRMGTTESLLNGELDRNRRIAESEGALAELTRDYEVNNDIYQDLLRRRENARVSMVLDEDQRGLTFRVQDAATLPARPSGLRMLHFALAGMLLALAVPFGLLFALVRLDPRVRSAVQLSAQAPELHVLATVPAYVTARERQRHKTRLLLSAALVAGVFACYGLVYWIRVLNPA